MSVLLKILNFQSYEDVEIEVKGFTALAGPNNIGKSAVARAVRGAFQNSPSTHLIRRGAPEMKVEVDFGAFGFAWGRKSGATGRPQYQIGSSIIYPGREVPQEVKASGVLAVEIGGDWVWPQFAKQGDAPFLMDRSGSHLAEAVSDPGRADQLSQASRILESDRRAARSRLGLVQESLREAKALHSYLQPIQLQIKQASVPEEIFAVLQKQITQLERLQDLHTRLHQCNHKVTQYKVLSGINLPQGLMLQAQIEKLQQLRTLQTHRARSQSKVSVLHRVIELVGPKIPNATQVAGLLRKLLTLRKISHQTQKIRVYTQDAASLLMVRPHSTQELETLEHSRGRLVALKAIQTRMKEVQIRFERDKREMQEALAAKLHAMQCRDDVVGHAEVCPLCGASPPLNL